MNDPDRRRSPDGFDDDAIFADIVAHLNDEATEAGPAETQPAQDADAQAAQAAQTTHWAAADPPAQDPSQDADRTPPADEADPTQPAQDADPTQPADEADPTPPADRVERAPGAPTPIDSAQDSASQVWRAHQVEDEVEEHFEPPPVTPLPAGDLQFWAIIVGMTGGPLLLLYLVFFNRYASSLWILLAIGMSVGGFALLVSRMPGHDDDDDNGARL